MRGLKDYLGEVIKSVDSDSEVWGGTPGNFKFNPSLANDDIGGFIDQTSGNTCMASSAKSEKKHCQSNPGAVVPVPVPFQRPAKTYG